MPTDGKVGVSVIIAVRNGEAYLQETLESIARQSYRDFETIVIDDRSSDNTAFIARSFMEKDSRFRLFANPFGEGQALARNYGVSLSRAEWIAVCDADDLWHEDKLSRQVEFRDGWAHPFPLVMVGTAAYLINGKGDVIGHLSASPCSLDQYWEWRARDESFMLNHSSVLYEKTAFLKINGYRADYVGAEDTEMISRMAERGVVVNLSEPLFMYRKHLGSFMLANTRTQEINFLRIKENIARRRTGQDELAYEQFLALFERKRTASSLRRFNRAVKGKYLYRAGAIYSVNGHRLKGFLYLSLASLYSYRKVWSGLRRKYGFIKSDHAALGTRE